jgi:hypothetical protein
MSHSQIPKEPDKAGSVVLGSVFSSGRREARVDKVDVGAAEHHVLDGMIRGSMDPLVSFLMNEAGLYAQGLLGCVLAPYGEKSLTAKGRKYLVVTDTVPVWIIRDGRGRSFLSSSEFTSWVKRKLPLTNPKVGDPPGYYEGTRMSPSINPSYRVVPPSSTAGGFSSRRVPPPSSVGGAGKASHQGRRVPPASTVSFYRNSNLRVPEFSDSVSQIGDIGPRYGDSLTTCEADFSSTPRVKNSEGVETFDENEYFTRLDALNGARASRGLPEYTGTPSTYHR